VQTGARGTGSVPTITGRAVAGLTAALCAGGVPIIAGVPGSVSIGIHGVGGVHTIAGNAGGETTSVGIAEGAVARTIAARGAVGVPTMLGGAGAGPRAHMARGAYLSSQEARELG